jgi:hypothetical protein
MIPPDTIVAVERDSRSGRAFQISRIHAFITCMLSYNNEFAYIALHEQLNVAALEVSS